MPSWPVHHALVHLKAHSSAGDRGSKEAEGVWSAGHGLEVHWVAASSLRYL